MTARRWRDDGQALVVAPVAILAATCCMTFAVEAGGLLRARAVAVTAADAAALAAAGAVVDPNDDPMAAATRVARANYATLIACDCHDLPFEVVVSVAVTTPFGLADLFGPITATAQATVVVEP